MTDYHLLDHPNPSGPNFYTFRRRPISVIVVHTAENLPYFRDDVDKGAENVASYGSSTTRNVSWHSTVDSDSIIPMLPDDHTAWHVRGYNSLSLGLEIATQANRWDQAPEDWLAGVVENTATVIAEWAERHDIPIRRITKEQVDNGEKGIVAHADLDQYRRSDPGRDFPWDRVLTRAREILLGEGQPSTPTPVEPTPTPAPAPAPQPTPAPQPAPTLSSLVDELPTLRRPVTNYHVGVAQALLAAHEVEVEHSFRPNHSPDRVFGSNTEDAVREFQVENDAMVDGIVGPETWGFLISNLADTLVSKTSNNRGFRARQVQALLANASFPPAQSFDSSHNPDGHFGFHTDRAVKKFQKRRGLIVDGIVGPNTLRALLGL